MALLLLASGGHAQAASLAEPQCKALEAKVRPPYELTTYQLRLADAATALEYLDGNCGNFSAQQRETARSLHQKNYQDAVAECQRSRGAHCDPRSASASGPGAKAPPQAPGASASTRKGGASGGWPADMEPGNLYFVVEKPHPQWFRRALPIMVSATSASEAIRRVEQAHATMLEPTISRGESRPYMLIDGGECIGPAWGAVMTNRSNPPDPDDAEWVWGAGCAKTPALAIEAAFAACRRKDPQACDRRPGEDYWWGPTISLALSGSSSWSGRMCANMCMPSEDDSFGSFNVFTANALLSTNRINGMQDAISKLGKQCDGRPCFYTVPSLRCYDTTPFDQIAERCTDTRLTPNGYNGSIRMTAE